MKKNLDDLKKDYYMWRSGWRQFLTTILPILVSAAAVLLTIQYAYLDPQEREEKKERFEKLVDKFESPYPVIQERAFRILYSDHGKDGCEAVRDILLPKAFKQKDRELIKKILNTLPEDLCFEDGDITETRQYIENLAAAHFPEFLRFITIEESWIYVGNYNFENNVWVAQKRAYGFDTTLSNIEPFKPSDLIGKEFSVEVFKLHVREGHPYEQKDRTIFPEQKDTLEKGDNLIVKEIKEIKHPLAKHVKRIWAQIDYKKFT